MLCQKCKKNEATIHMTQIVNGNKREFHLCEECAAMTQGIKVIPIVTLDQWLNQIISAANAGLAAEEEERVCPYCGITYGEFRAGGRLGCPRCYESFAEPLEAVIKRLHGGGQHHTGKMPRQVDQDIVRERRLTKLKEELAQAIKTEAYEEAAILRDQIRELELAKGGEDSL
jgi:protein arginine kinase activator